MHRVSRFNSKIMDLWGLNLKYCQKMITSTIVIHTNNRYSIVFEAKLSSKGKND